MPTLWTFLRPLVWATRPTALGRGSGRGYGDGYGDGYGYGHGDGYGDN